MICKKCGLQLGENDKFCANCGTLVEQQSVEQSNTQTTEQQGEPLVPSTNGKQNSNLKNALIILLICLVVGGISVLGLSMLFKKKGADAIDYAINNMTDMNNFKLNIALDMDASYEGEKVSVSATADSVIDIKNKMASLNIKASTQGVSIEIPAYMDLNNNYIYLKVPMLGDGWYKASISDITDEEIEIDEENKRLAIEDYLRNDEFIEKVSSDKNIDHYVLHFTKDVLKKLSEDEDNEFDYEMFEEMGLNDGFDVDLYLNTKENYITKIELDLSGKTINDVVFDKFIFTIEITDVDKSDKIVIPQEALDAEDISGMDDYDYDYDYDNEYVEDYKITDYGYTISYNLPENSEASSVNSEDFKIYRNNGVRVVLSIYYDTKDSFFQNVEEEKESALEYGYTNVELSDIKELSHDGKTFYYKVLTYTTSYGTNNYEVYLCYELDGEHVYNVTFEDEDNNGSVTEDAMKSFLNFTVSK